MTAALVALLALGVGGWCLRGDLRANTVGLGLILFGLGPLFGALESQGLAVGAAAGVGRLGVTAGLPLVTLAPWVGGRDPELVRRVRAVVFVTAMLAAMADPRGVLAQVVAVGSGVGLLGAAVARRELGLGVAAVGVGLGVWGVEWGWGVMVVGVAGATSPER